ncbi:protein kinase family protein [Halobacillus sp. B23F22_1]|uniref:protein kinase family protein n=1 Tax=Halobacillus sp. B23F22_1 TaxID=3459514 RepID=UPI00373F52B6
MKDVASVVSSQEYKALADSVRFLVCERKMVLKTYDCRLQLVGSGRSAYVFKLPHVKKAIKVFYPPFEHLAELEAKIYDRLAGSSYFPTLYEVGTNYFVMDYIEGKTLFQCILEGRRIHRRHIVEVDKAIAFARKKNLNPSDIHLHNLLLTKDDTVKVIDVARYKQTKNCTQWKDLKQAFDRYYSRRFFPKKLPAFCLNTISKIYKKRAVPSQKEKASMDC